MTVSTALSDRPGLTSCERLRKGGKKAPEKKRGGREERKEGPARHKRPVNLTSTSIPAPVEGETGRGKGGPSKERV